jgi:hypothetical protein
MRGRHALVLSTIMVLAHAGLAQAQSGGSPLSAAEVATACAPTQMMTPPTPTLRIVGTQDTAPRGLIGPQELVIVDGGTQAGLQIGQAYYIRREYWFGSTPSKTGPRTITTVGSLRIVSLNETTAIGQIDLTCEGVFAGDYLEPFTRPVAIAGEPGAPFSTLDFSSLARVMFGKEERRMGATGEFMLLERGNATLEVGTRVAVYRDLHSPGLPLTAVGEGVIVSLSNGAPLMRITAAREAVESGDYVVPHR